MNQQRSGLGHSYVTVFNNFRRPGTIVRRVFRRPGPQSIDISITHAEDRSNQNGVVDLEIGRSLIARCSNILSSDMVSTKLDFPSNVQKRLELGRDLCALPICLDVVDQLLIASERSRRHGSVNCLAEEAAVAPGDVGRNHFALSA